jgi:hypothetical protein
VNQHSVLMTESSKVFAVFLNDSALCPQLVIAASQRIEGEHLVFLTEDGALAALFLLEMVKHWSRIGVATA